MGKNVFEFFLSELDFLQVVCKNPECKAVTEFPIDHVAQRLSSGVCTFCGTSFLVGNENPVIMLARALVKLKMSKTVDVRVRVYDDPSPTT